MLVQIKDICSFVCSGGTPSKKHPEYYAGGTIPWLNTSEIQFNRIYSTEHFISDLGLSYSSAKWVPKNAVIVAMYGATAARVAISKIPLTTNQACCNLVIDPQKADYRFVYYWLLSKYSQLAYLANGGAQQNLNAGQIKDFPIEIPSLNKQKIIADLLSVLDDKIELNNRINENLANQIQAIYSNEYDPVSHFPNGILSDICVYSSARIAVSDLSLSSYFSTENMLPNKAGAVDAANLPSVSQTTKCHKGDVLVSNIRPYFKKIVYVTEECGCSTDVLCFTPKKEIYSPFLFSTLYTDRFFDYMVAGAKGTKMPRGDKKQIMNYPFVIPPMESLGKFNRVVAPMLEQIASNRKENKILATVRDTLLPKLMSGEVDVSEVEL